jgi:ABC-2 type transport system ATP-binding protein
VVSGNVRDIVERLKGHVRLQIEVQSDPDLATRVLAQQPGIGQIQRDNHLIHADFTAGTSELPKLLAALVEAGVKVSSFGEEELDLEDIFIRLTRGIVS